MTPEERRRRFEEFAIEWTPKLRNIAYRSGFRTSDLEDCVQEVLWYLFDRDHLSKYDESRGKLTTYMYGMSLVRVLDYKRRMGKRSGNEFNASEAFDADSVNVNVNIVTDRRAASELGTVEMRMALTETYACLSQTDAVEGKALARLFSDIVNQVMETGRVSFREIARQRGLSRSAMTEQTEALMRSGAMQELRLALRENTLAVAR